MTSLLDFIKKKLPVGSEVDSVDIHTRPNGDLISLHFFCRKESRLKVAVVEYYISQIIPIFPSQHYFPLCIVAVKSFSLEGNIQSVISVHFVFVDSLV
jgi:hypothetical protein